MIEGVTSTGFEFNYDERILNDWRYVRAISGAHKKDKLDKLASSTEIADLLLGDDGMDKLIEHVQSLNDGYAPADQVEKLIIEIMRASKVKN